MQSLPPNDAMPMAWLIASKEWLTFERFCLYGFKLPQKSSTQREFHRRRRLNCRNRPKCCFVPPQFPECRVHLTFASLPPRPAGEANIDHRAGLRLRHACRFAGGTDVGGLRVSGWPLLAAVGVVGHAVALRAARAASTWGMAKAANSSWRFLL